MLKCALNGSNPAFLANILNITHLHSWQNRVMLLTLNQDDVGSSPTECTNRINMAKLDKRFDLAIVLKNTLSGVVNHAGLYRFESYY